MLILIHAEVAHLVERDLAKVEVAGSSPVFRSKKFHSAAGWNFLFLLYSREFPLMPRWWNW